jgi:hypothetical protein
MCYKFHPSTESYHPCIAGLQRSCSRVFDTELNGANMLKLLAEEVGFEPTEPLGSPVFKTGAIDHSATLPSLVFKTSALNRSATHPSSAGMTGASSPAATPPTRPALARLTRF